MSRSYPVLLVVLAAIWGASYLFIKIAVSDLEPTVLMTVRLLLSAPPLIAFLALRSGIRRAIAQVAGAWREGTTLGVVNGALPFTLLAWGETHVDSGIAAIANASVPIFVALLAIKFRPSERSSGLRLVGIVVGLGGVAVLAGGHPEGGWWEVAGTLAVVGASLSYAVGGLYGQHAVASVPGPVMAASSMLYGGLLLLPLALAQLPERFPSWETIGSVLGLALAGTALAQLILFRLLRLYGAARMALVTYLIPLFALLYGALILDEPVTVAAIAGLGLILGGVALGSGVRRAHRPVVEPSR